MYKKSLILLSLNTMLFASIHGTVFEDLNLNGIQDEGEIGLKGIHIKSVCDDGISIQTITNDKGYYHIKDKNATHCRIEAFTDNKNLQAANYSNNNSSPLVDIVKNYTQHNISMISKDNYCQNRPDVVIAAFPLHEDNNITKPQEHGALFELPTPKNGDFITDTTKRTLLKKRKQIGAIWGLAYDKHHKDIYASSVLMRYVPLHNHKAGMIYKVDNNNTLVPFIDLGNKNVGIDDNTTFPRDLRNSKDYKIKALIGRAGLGDLDITPDSKYLYSVNLYKKELVKISIKDKNVTTFKIPNPYLKSECNASMVRPWALKVTNNGVFIGSVCEDRIEDGIGATIQKFDDNNFSTIAKTNTLRYLRPRGYNPKLPTSAEYQNSNWYNGKKSHLPQPMLTDIEFTTNGDMVLGYSDRAAYMREREGSQGDVRRMCKNPDGSYTDESTAVAPTDCSSHKVKYKNNSDVYYEYYVGDYYKGYLGEDGHPETAVGSLAVKRGDDYIYIGMVDGTQLFEAGSIGILDNASGDKVAAQGLINNISIKKDPKGELEIYGAKAGGIGDIELLCDTAPIEIGNYIWMDVNKNGIQDPSEPPLSHVKVKLYNKHILVGQGFSDENGHYYFGGINHTNLIDQNQSIKNDTNYTIKIAQTETYNQKATIANVNHDLNDTIDNDAITKNGDHIIELHTSLDNNDSYDCGIEPVYGCLDIQVFQDMDGDGILTAKDIVPPKGVKITLIDKIGHTYTYATDKHGEVKIPKILVGKKYIEVDTKSPQIPVDIRWDNTSTSVTITNQKSCSKVSFIYHKPWFQSLWDSIVNWFKSIINTILSWF